MWMVEWWNLAKVWQSLRICLSSLWNFPLKFDSPPPRISRINKLLVSDRYILSSPSVISRNLTHNNPFHPVHPLWIIKSCWMHHSEGITINSTRYHDFAATIKQDFIIYITPSSRRRFIKILDGFTPEKNTNPAIFPSRESSDIAKYNYLSHRGWDLELGIK